MTIGPPTATAVRGLREELGLSLGGRDLAVEDVSCLGVFFDAIRWQVVFAFLAQLELTASDLIARLQLARGTKRAPHAYEHKTGAPLAWDIRDKRTRAVLLGEDHEWRLASTHATMALMLALVYRHGTAAVADALR